MADTVPGIEPRWKVKDNGSKYKLYSIPGDLALGVRVTVHDPKTKSISSDDLSHLSRRYPTMGKRQKDSSIPPIPTNYPKSPKEEKGGDNTDITHEESKPEKSDLSMVGCDFGKTGKWGMVNEALDTGKAPFPSGNTAGNDGKNGNGPLRFCAVCGEDLTGHGVVEMGGKSYCTRPGCGYPARDEAKAT